LFCPKCGREIQEGIAFCPHCGFPQGETPLPPQRIRPDGVTVLSILGMIGGVLGCLLGAAYLIMAFAISAFSEYGLPSGSQEAIAALYPFLSGFGVFILGLGVLMFLAAFGLFTGKRWGWHLALIYLVISLGTSGMVDVGSILESLPYVAVGAVINVLLIFYFTRPRVKAYFGEVKVNLWLMVLIFLVTLVASNVLMSMTISSLKQLFLPLTSL
jgi:hypothetical protein